MNPKAKRTSAKIKEKMKHEQLLNEKTKLLDLLPVSEVRFRYS